MAQPDMMQVWFLMRSSALLFTFSTSQYHCTHIPQLCHEGNLLLHRITTHPHLFHHLWVWLLPAHFSSQVVLLLLSPFSVLPGGFELPFPAIFTQSLACSGAGTQCCYQLPTSWGMWSAGGPAGNHRGMGALGMQPRLDGARLLLHRKF